MKIAIPVEDDSGFPDVAQSLGRAAYYLVFDTETEASVIISNPAKDSPSGTGVKAAQTIVDSGAEVLLTIRCGDRAYEVLTAANVDVMSAFTGKAEENLNAYFEGRLSKLETVHSGHHHGAE